MMGKILVIFIVLSAALAGGAMYYLQEYAYYHPVVLAGTSQADDTGAAALTELQLTSLVNQTPQTILATGFQGIDAESSPIRFRACFTVPNSLAMLTETYVVYENATPLTGPKWFDCYDAADIGASLESGDAIAFLSVANIVYGIDRVIAVYDDGRAFAWHQLNECGEKVFDGEPAPQGCPPPPERSE